MQCHRAAGRGTELELLSCQASATAAGSWRRKWQPAPVFLSGESHGQRSLMGYSPQSCKESDATLNMSLSPLRGYSRMMGAVGRPNKSAL